MHSEQWKSRFWRGSKEVLYRQFWHVNSSRFQHHPALWRRVLQLALTDSWFEALETISWVLGDTLNNENHDSGRGQCRSCIGNSGTSTHRILNETRHFRSSSLNWHWQIRDSRLLRQYRGSRGGQRKSCIGNSGTSIHPNFSTTLHFRVEFS